MQKNKSQGGFTLVEVAVGILISGIILFFTTGMVVSVANMFDTNRSRSEEKQLGDAVFNYIVEELTYGNYIQIFPDEASANGVSTGSRILTVQDGRLYCTGSDVFGEAFYQGCSVQFTASVYNDYYIDLTVTILDKDGDETYTNATTINVLNMKLTAIAIDDNGGGLNPYITYDRQGD